LFENDNSIDQGNSMRTTKVLVRAGAVTAMAIGAVAVVAPDTEVGRAARRLANRLSRDVRYAVASAPGILYRLAGRRPDPHVADDVLADRIRSSLGPLERRLDVPHIHVMVDHHIAILHGVVDTDAEAARLEFAVMNISGVEGVESHLHHGLTAGDTRPSEGALSRASSAALTELLDAARAAGAHDPALAVHAVLCGFTDRVPADEREQMLCHLPADVRALLEGPRRHGGSTPRLRTVPQLVGAVVAEGGIEPDRADDITRTVVATLRRLVPEEARDVAAVLPDDLRELWDSAALPG
jgi:uncharacterized protein (DUF2267 family)